MGFPRQECWSRLPCPPLQGIFLIQGSNQHLLHPQVGSLPLSHLGSPVVCTGGVLILNSGTEEIPPLSQEGLGMDGKTRLLISNESLTAVNLTRQAPRLTENLLTGN